MSCAVPLAHASDFLLAGSLNAARYAHAASLLPSGDVLVTGGEYNNLGALSSTEIYDVTHDQWHLAAALSSARSFHTSTQLPSGKIILAGGDSIGTPGGSVLSSTELYNPSNGVWSLGAPMLSRRTRHTSTLLPSGKLLVAGGSSSTSVMRSAELFDPVTGSWSAAGPLHQARWMHTATLLSGGRVLVVGGQANDGSFVQSAEIYDPATNTWAIAADPGSPLVGQVATLLPNGKVLVAGGYDGAFEAVARLFDPDAGTWSMAASMSTPRQFPSATLLSTGQVLVAGGRSGAPNLLSSAEEYDPASGAWRSIGGMQVARYLHTATLLRSGKVLVAGGTIDTNTLASAELYSPTSNISLVSIAPPVTVVGQSYVVTFSVSAAAQVPVGTLTVSDDLGAHCGPVPLDASGNGSCILASTQSGIRMLTATFRPAAGSDTLPSSVDAGHVVEAAPMLLDVELDPEPATTDEPAVAHVTLTVQAPGSGQPSGIVVVRQPDSGASCSVLLPDDECTLPASAAGSHAIEADYLGDADFEPASWSGDHVVYDRHVGIEISAIAPEPSVVGESVSVSYSVAAPSGPATGTVTVRADTGESCSAPVSAGACSLAFMVDGSRALVAEYAGDALHDPSQSAERTHAVVDASTSLSITRHTPEPSLPGQPVEVAAVLAVTSPGAGTPSGPIFVGDGVDTCVIAQGDSMCVLTLTTRGPRILTASYAGDGNYASSSAQTTHRVNREPLASGASYTSDEDASFSAAAAEGVLSAGASDADGDTLTIANAGTSMASGIGGTVDLHADGGFVYTPPADANGTATFAYTVSDGLEEAFGTATIVVGAVNDAPSFAIAAIPAWPAGEAGVKTQPGFASVIDWGPPDEKSQHVRQWIVRSVEDPAGVASDVAIALDGTLSYRLSGRAGSAIVGVSLQDDGGTADGGVDTSAEQTFAITVAAGLDLSIGIEDSTAFAQGGLPIDYVVNVRNAGPNDAIGARVRDLLPFDLVGAAWTCSAAGGATCTASGSGDIDDTVDLPSGATLTYTLSATVLADPEVPVENTVSVSPPDGVADLDAGNDRATDTDVVGVFADGFDTVRDAEVVQQVDAAGVNPVPLIAPVGDVDAIVGSAVPVVVCRVDDGALLVQRRNTRAGTAQWRLALRGDSGWFAFSRWAIADDEPALRWQVSAPPSMVGAAQLMQKDRIATEVARPR